MTVVTPVTTEVRRSITILVSSKSEDVSSLKVDVSSTSSISSSTSTSDVSDIDEDLHNLHVLLQILLNVHCIMQKI